MILKVTKREYLYWSVVDLYHKQKAWMNTFNNPLYVIHMNAPQSNPKVGNWWRTSCWRVRK